MCIALTPSRIARKRESLLEELDSDQQGLYVGLLTHGSRLPSLLARLDSPRTWSKRAELVLALASWQELLSCLLLSAWALVALTPDFLSDLAQLRFPFVDVAAWLNMQLEMLSCTKADALRQAFIALVLVAIGTLVARNWWSRRKDLLLAAKARSKLTKGLTYEVPSCMLEPDEIATPEEAAAINERLQATIGRAMSPATIWEVCGLPPPTFAECVWLLGIAYGALVNGGAHLLTHNPRWLQRIEAPLLLLRRWYSALHGESVIAIAPLLASVVLVFVAAVIATAIRVTRWNDAYEALCRDLTALHRGSKSDAAVRDEAWAMTRRARGRFPSILLHLLDWFCSCCQFAVGFMCGSVLIGWLLCPGYLPAYALPAYGAGSHGCMPYVWAGSHPAPGPGLGGACGVFGCAGASGLGRVMCELRGGAGVNLLAARAWRRGGLDGVQVAMEALRAACSEEAEGEQGAGLRRRAMQALTGVQAKRWNGDCKSLWAMGGRWALGMPWESLAKGWEKRTLGMRSVLSAGPSKPIRNTAASVESSDRNDMDSAFVAEHSCAVEPPFWRFVCTSLDVEQGRVDRVIANVAQAASSCEEKLPGASAAADQHQGGGGSSNRLLLDVDGDTAPSPGPTSTLPMWAKLALAASLALLLLAVRPTVLRLLRHGKRAGRGCHANGDTHTARAGQQQALKRPHPMEPEAVTPGPKAAAAPAKPGKQARTSSGSGAPAAAKAAAAAPKPAAAKPLAGARDAASSGKRAGGAPQRTTRSTHTASATASATADAVPACLPEAAPGRAVPVSGRRGNPAPTNSSRGGKATPARPAQQAAAPASGDVDGKQGWHEVSRHGGAASRTSAAAAAPSATAATATPLGSSRPVASKPSSIDATPPAAAFASDASSPASPPPPPTPQIKQQAPSSTAAARGTPSGSSASPAAQAATPPPGPADLPIPIPIPVPVPVPVPAPVQMPSGAVARPQATSPAPAMAHASPPLLGLNPALSRYFGSVARASTAAPAPQSPCSSASETRTSGAAAVAASTNGTPPAAPGGGNATAPAMAASQASAQPAPAPIQGGFWGTAAPGLDPTVCMRCQAAPRVVTLLHGITAHMCFCQECGAGFAVGAPCPVCAQPVQRILRANPQQVGRLTSAWRRVAGQ